MSALQLRKDLSHDESTLAVIATVEEGSSSEPDLTKIPRPLNGHHDVKAEGQAKGLSPPGEINHKIDFLSRERSPATNRYHTIQPTLAKFYKQLNDLLKLVD